MYFAGQLGNIGYINTDTYSWNALPSIPSGKLIRRILVITPDDIWAGLDDVGKNTLTKIDIYDTQSVVDPTTIDAYINGVSVYSGVSGYNGTSSSISATTVDGYNGYRLIIDKETSYSSGQSVSVQINAKDNKGN